MRISGTASGTAAHLLRPPTVNVDKDKACFVEPQRKQGVSLLAYPRVAPTAAVVVVWVPTHGRGESDAAADCSRSICAC